MNNYFNNLLKDLKKFKDRLCPLNYVWAVVENFFPQVNLTLYPLMKGLKLTILNSFNPKVTIAYPLEKAAVSARFRGEHALRRYYNGEERCIACKLCEVICPALAISIESNIVLSTRKTTRYEIDMSKCIYCGFCQEACPVEAIVESNNYEYYINKKAQFIFKKDRLLLNGLKWETELFYNLQLERSFR